MTEDDLIRAQETHLRFLEEWTKTLPKVAGVSIVQALNYELVQVLNQSFLRQAEEEGEVIKA